MFLFYPYRGIFQADSDEGINLIKAMLVEDGYPLFSQVWSDQPPVFTLVLAQVFKQAQNDLLAARTLVLLSASLLVGCLAYCVQNIWSHWHALTVVLLLPLLPYFPVLSTSIMVGLPAISLACLALAAMVAWHENHKLFWLLISAAALGASIMTKLFTGILAPIFMLGIFLDVIAGAEAAGDTQGEERLGNLQELFRAGRQHWRRAAGQVLVWLGVFGLAAGGITLMVVKPGHLLDLIVPHLAAGQTEYFDAYQEEYPIRRLFAGTLPFFILAGMGALHAVQTRRWLALYPLAWAATAFTLLSFHSPVWYHHTLLVTLPAAVLAAGAAGELLVLLFNYIVRREYSPAALARWVILAIVLGGLLWQRLPPTIKEFTDQPYFIELRSAQPAREEKILEDIEPYQPYAHWMFTDLPMFAFRAGIRVPPELAVLTSKRLASGELTELEIARLLSQYQPEIILLGRYDFPGLQATLAEGYRLEGSRMGIELYIRKDLPDL